MEKTSMLRQIIMKLFCLHEMVQTDSVQHLNIKGETVSKVLLYKCTKCGKLRKETL